MISFASIFCLIALLLTFMISAVRSKPNLRRRNEDGLICLILQNHAQTSQGDVDYLECDLISDDGVMAYGLQITLPDDVVEKNHKALRNGDWYVQISGATVEEEMIEGYGSIRTRVVVPDHAEIVTLEPETGDSYVDAVQGSRGRALSTTSTFGNHNVAVVRVSAYDSQPFYSAAQLQAAYFSLSSYSVTREFALCSSSKIWFQGYDPNFSVIDVTLPGNANQFTMTTGWPIALNLMLNKLGISNLAQKSIDHVAFVYCSKLGGGSFYGVGAVRSFRTLYNDKFGAIPNTAMHEFAHNIGMGHAGKGSDQYGDETDLMGYGSYTQFGPSKCFNGYHLYLFGWYADRTISVNPYQHRVIQLACFANYGKTKQGQFVVANVGTYFLAYNQATGVNTGTGAAKNQVTISQQQPGAYSLNVGAIDTSTAPFQVPNYQGGSGTLFIKVCQVGNAGGVIVAVVSIGINNVNCS